MNRELNPTKVLEALKIKRLPNVKTIEEVGKFVTDYLIKEHGIKNAAYVNCGYCFIWAYLVWALMKEPIRFATSNGHVVVIYRNKYYDSEHLEGVYYPEDIFKEFEYRDESELDETICEVDVCGMTWYWSRCGVAKDILRRYIRKTYWKLYKYISRNGFGRGIGLEIDDIPNTTLYYG